MPEFRTRWGPIATAVMGTLKLAWLVTFVPSQGWSFEPTLPTATIPDLNSYINKSSIDTLIQTIGFGMDHRPYEPATPLGASYDFGIEATLVGTPNNFGNAISNLATGSSGSDSSSNSSSSGSSSPSSPIPFVPSVKVHLRHGFGESFDVGLSGLYVPSTLPYVGGTFLLGGDLKYVFFYPEEGLTWAFRASYNSINLDVSYTDYRLSIRTFTVSPQLVISRKVGFADPYVGAGFQYTYGTIAATVPSPPIDLLPGVSIAPISISADGNGSGIFFFGGLSFLSIIKFRLTIEGAFNPAGENYFGTKIGFTL